MIPLLRTYLAPYWKQSLLVMGLLLVQSVGNLFLPNLQGDIINNGIVTGDDQYILIVGGVMLLVTALLSVASIFAVYWGARIAMGFGRDVRQSVFGQVERFSKVELDHFGPASLITRNTNDVLQVQTVVFIGLTLMLSAPIMIVGGTMMAVRADAALSALLLVIVPLMAIVIAVVMRRAIPLFETLQRKIDSLNRVTRESLSGIRVIRAFVRTRHEEERFERVNLDLFATGTSVNRLFALTIPVLTGIVNLSTVAVMWFGASQVASGAMDIGSLTAFLQYLTLILFSVLTAVMMFILVPRAAVSAGRIQEVLQQEPSIRDPERSTTPPALERAATVEFRDVEFSYPGAEEPVLCGVSFIARPGERTAIVGSTGSGKSTLINLVPRLYDTTAGQVLIDGVDVKQMDRQDLWARLGYVPQKAFLFTGTVAHNLRYGDPDASDEELWQVLTVAQARDFVAQMDGQLEAPITQGGSSVSGGQRQRLAIARALVRKAGVYIFDDSFSALDVGTDARLRAALEREFGWAATIIVAQRVATIMDAEKIIVLEAGRVVGTGTHEELLDRCETYQEIVSSQLLEPAAAA